MGNVYNINESGWEKSAIDLKAKGMSTRGVARTLFKNENLRNRLNEYFKTEEVLEAVYHRECELAEGESIQGYKADVVYLDESEALATQKSPVKMLYYDIETTLAKSYHWGQWQQNLSVKQQIQESHMLSHAWSWNDEEVFSSVLTPEEVLSQDDERIVYECWSLLDNCDIVVAHNGKRFDIKKVNGYFLKYGLPKPTSIFHSSLLSI